MEKFKGSFLAKIIAWILISVSGTISVISLVMGALFYERDMYYSNSIEDSKKNIISDINEEYAEKVMRDRETGTNLEYFKNTNFRYGLFKSDDIDKVDFQKIQYIESNLPSDVGKEQLEIFYMPTNDETEYYFDDYIISIGDHYVYNIPDQSWYSYYIDNICFDVNQGIFYYHAVEDDMFYPICKVCITFDNTNYHYSYLKSEQKYVLDYYDSPKEYLDDELTQEIIDQKEIIIDILTNEEMMDFAKLNETAFNCNTWNRVTFDDVREYYDLYESLNIIQLKNDRNVFSGDQEYYLNENYTLFVAANSGLESYENYYVAVLPPKKIVGNLQGDLYERTIFALNLAEQYKYSIWVVFTISALVTLLLFLFLLYAAGYRRNKDTKELYLKQSFLQRIPLEIEWTVYCVIIVEIVVICSMIVESNDINEIIVYLLFFGLLFAWATLAEFLNFAVRVKLGKWWHHTICYWIVAKIGTFICRPLAWVWDTCVKNPLSKLAILYENKRIIWKFWILFCAFKCIEGFLVILLGIDFEMFFFLTVIEMATFGTFSCFCIIQMQKLQDQSRRLANGDYKEMLDTTKMYSVFKEHGENLNHVGEGITKAVDEKMKSEYFKTELITNVSHDIKTPLTSIINYVDLLQKEELHNEKAVEYLEILDRQSSKLKKLIEDLVEASKASSGNLPVSLEKIDLCVLISQTVGEWTERLQQENLELVISQPEGPVYINADGRHLWRVVDNLLNNICKYAQPGSRVYINIEINQNVQLIFKNISKYQLNISPEELLERFVQGDKSRNSSGHGLGLSIANSLMTLMKGELELVIDGDLFKVILSFKEA